MRECLECKPIVCLSVCCRVCMASPVSLISRTPYKNSGQVSRLNQSLLCSAWYVLVDINFKNGSEVSRKCPIGSIALQQPNSTTGKIKPSYFPRCQMHGKISQSLKQMARRLEREITTVFCLQSGTLQLIVCVYF